MDVESFKGKIVLSLIDNLLVGVLATLLILFFNSKYDEYQRLREQSISVSKIHSDILLTQRSELITLVEEYFTITSAVLVNGEISKDQLISLEGIVNKIETVSFNMTLIDESLDKYANVLKASLQDFNKQMYQLESDRSLEIEIFQREINDIRQSYSAILSAFRDASINAIKRDLLDDT